MVLFCVYLPSLQVFDRIESSPSPCAPAAPDLPGASSRGGGGFISWFIGGGRLVVNVWCVLIWTLCSCKQELGRSRTHHRVQQNGACAVTWASFCLSYYCVYAMLKYMFGSNNWQNVSVNMRTFEFFHDEHNHILVAVTDAIIGKSKQNDGRAEGAVRCCCYSRLGVLLTFVSCWNVQGWACSGSSSPWLPRAVCLKPRPSTDCTFTWVVRELRHVYVHECLVKWMTWTQMSLFRPLSLDYCNIYVAKWLIIDSTLILNHVLKSVSVIVKDVF